MLTQALHHIAWLIHHGYAHRAQQELQQVIWALRHGYPA